jgi:hypothetical protein
MIKIFFNEYELFEIMIMSTANEECIFSASEEINSSGIREPYEAVWKLLLVRSKLRWRRRQGVLVNGEGCEWAEKVEMAGERRRRTTWLERQKVISAGTLPSFSSCPAFILLFHSVRGQRERSLAPLNRAGELAHGAAAERKLTAQICGWVGVNFGASLEWLWNGARAYDYFLLIRHKNATKRAQLVTPHEFGIIFWPDRHFTNTAHDHQEFKEFADT